MTNEEAQSVVRCLMQFNDAAKMSDLYQRATDEINHISQETEGKGEVSDYLRAQRIVGILAAAFHQQELTRKWVGHKLFPESFPAVKTPELLRRME